MKTFFQQQFSSKPTPAQVTFDVFMGITAPIVCIAIDRFYFDGFIGNLQEVSYAAIIIWVFTLALWLFLDLHTEVLLNKLSGPVLLTGALYASYIGIVMFPLIVMGLITGVMGVIDYDNAGLFLIAMSLFGFVPFGTAFVFLRNGYRALQRANKKFSFDIPRNRISYAFLFVSVAVVGYLWGGLRETQRQITMTEDINFPVYLPSSDVLHPLGIAHPPLITLKYEESCRYLDIRYNYASETTGFEDEAMTIYVSDGCGPCSFWRDASQVDLNWAEGGTAMILDDDADSSFLVFYEPLNHFQYCVFSNEPLSTTLDVLEAME